MASMLLRDSTLESIAPTVNAPLKEDGSCTYYLGVRGKGSCVGGHSECGAWDEQFGFSSEKKKKKKPHSIPTTCKHI
jgi:hypothetical protein